MGFRRSKMETEWYKFRGVTPLEHQKFKQPPTSYHQKIEQPKPKKLNINETEEVHY